MFKSFCALVTSSAKELNVFRFPAKMHNESIGSIVDTQELAEQLRSDYLKLFASSTTFEV